MDHKKLQLVATIINDDKDHEGCFWIGGINIKTGEHNPDKCYWPEEPCKTNNAVNQSDVTPNIHTILAADAVIHTQNNIPYMESFIHKRQPEIPICQWNPSITYRTGWCPIGSVQF